MGLISSAGTDSVMWELERSIIGWPVVSGIFVPKIIEI